jgi:DNA polymerase (family 10)
MTIHNKEISRLFDQYAFLLAIEGANPFRIRAYRNASRTISGLGHSLADLLNEGEDLSKLPAIGEDLAHKIVEIVETGQFKELERKKKRIPSSLVELTQVPGLGPRRIKALFEHLKIRSLDDLEAATKAGKLRTLPGFGEKLESQILSTLAHRVSKKARITLAEAEEIAEPLVRYIKEKSDAELVTVAGSYRRRKETVGDIDIIATGKNGEAIVGRFVAYPEVETIVSQGSTRSTVRLRSGIQVDLRVVQRKNYGSALHYFTGSKTHNIAIRSLGVKRGLKINEYGVYKKNKWLAGKSEKEVYAQVRLPYIEPELRENGGEIEAAKKGNLPELITLDDIKGDLHTHTNATDGHNTIAEMAEAAREHGYSYLAISDHTKHLTVAHGLDAKQFIKQMKTIDRLNKRWSRFRILKSAEVDILSDGRLDLDNEVLKDLDLVVGAIHYKFDLPEAEQTDRIVKAMDNPYLNILAHPTGRLFGEREAIKIDTERLMMAAKERNVCLEINSQPLRLDLSDTLCRLANEIGVKLVISTDAHSIETLDLIRFGVGQARRGWLEVSDVLNTRPWSKVKAAMKRN